jgi:hypothetical protein
VSIVVVPIVAEEPATGGTEFTDSGALRFWGERKVWLEDGGTSRTGLDFDGCYGAG